MPLLTEELLKRGIISKKKATSLEYELKSSDQREEELLLDKEIVSEDTLFSLKSRVLDIPLKRVNPPEIPAEVLKLIPEDSARYYKVVPLAREDDTVQVGMVYPNDIKAQEALKFLARQGKFSYDVYLITLSNFKSIFKRYRSFRGEVKKALEEFETEVKEEKAKRPRRPRREKMDKLVKKAPVSKVVSVLLRYAIEGEASDIHIEPTEDQLRIRFRIGGVLHTSLILPLKIHPAVVSRVKILCDLKIDETRVPQDGRFSTKVVGKKVDFRVSTFPTTLGEKVAIRVLDPTSRKKEFSSLGLRGRNLEVMNETAKVPHGLVLASGPTGCGKTTTLYALLDQLNEEKVNIVSVEDPVEYSIEGVNQSQVKPEIGYDFPQALRYILRQDPDVIMVGEIRDEETADLVTHAALTGHIVLSTLHTTGATGVIPRLIDMGVRSFLIPSTLQVALAQRLVRKLCDNCKEKVEANEKQKEIIRKQIDSLPPLAKEKVDLKKPIEIYEPRGCQKCNSEGYTGRVGVFEILEMTDDLSDMLSEEVSKSDLKKEARKQGMTTMEQDGILKVLEGITSLEEVMRISEERKARQEE